MSEAWRNGPKKDDGVYSIVKGIDKGKGTVLLDRGDYEEKMYNILNDPLHFVKLNRDPTAKSDDSWSNNYGHCATKEA
ncbi:hypothetical protein HPB52_007665 [Rhipicephalus sanguineus]|uniref:Uncharacterized protein n=1 Tax=Rhipicephalus sanguineus TaxID=34632 RepID=A0A9D4PXL6_RHISA|nr:hypothetical protein HPB52_007665 [Rhipicephalus sanguineus]